MKSYVVTLLFSFLFSFAFGQDASNFAKQIESQYKPIKGDSVFASMCECSNSQYRLFLNSFLEKGDKINYLTHRPDSTKWNFRMIFPKSQSFNEPIAAVYGWHQKYANYPVVNISFYSAMAYCEWLTLKYNSSSNRKFKKVVFRLPDADEWKFAAKGIMPKNAYPFEKRILPWDGLRFRDTKGNYLANYAPLLDNAIKRDDNYYLKVVDSIHFSAIGIDGFIYQAPCTKNPKNVYKPNEYGLYHMAGNVSELILEEGKTKGGSFISPGYYLLIDTDEQEFREELLGGPFIGFRPFMFVVER